MKPKGTMNQAVTKVNDVGPVILIVTEADAAHLCGRQHNLSRKWQEGGYSVGVLGDGMVQDGGPVNLGDLHGSATRVERQYAETGQKRRGLANDGAEVGLGGSTRSGIRTRIWGSAQQLGDSFNTRLVRENFTQGFVRVFR